MGGVHDEEHRANKRDLYTGCGIKNNPIRKLEFPENDQAYFAIFFIS